MQTHDVENSAAASLALGVVRRIALCCVAILPRRPRSPIGEIDIVAQRGGVLAIIEVKARSTYTQAAGAVTRFQRDQLVRTAQWYIATQPRLATLALRFDVLPVAPWRRPYHLLDAWRPGLS
jgi:putative endonuclease